MHQSKCHWTGNSLNFSLTLNCDSGPWSKAPLFDTGKMMGRDGSAPYRASWWGMHTCWGPAIQTELEAWPVKQRRGHLGPVLLPVVLPALLTVLLSVLLPVLLHALLTVLLSVLLPAVLTFVLPVVLNALLPVLLPVLLSVVLPVLLPVALPDLETNMLYFSSSLGKAYNLAWHKA